MAAHPPLLLAVANACHPDVDAADRFRVLLRAVEITDRAEWRTRLAARPEPTATVAEAMALLSELESEIDVDDDAGPPVPDASHPVLLTATLLLLCTLAASVVVLYRQHRSESSSHGPRDAAPGRG
jgi:hypothetical protein